MNGAGTAALWVGTRLVLLWLLTGPESWVTGDVAYFDRSLSSLDAAGVDDTLVEYPVPAVAVLALPWLVAEWLGTWVSHPQLYAGVVAVFAMLADVAFTWSLHRFGGEGRTPGLVVWLLGVPLLGATAYARFDMVPGVLAGAAVLLVASHPRVAAAAATAGAAVKLWPMLLLPAVTARPTGRRGVLGTVLVLSTVLVAVSLSVAGWARLLSPLTWQHDRGLQVESVLATPVMLEWAVHPARHEIYYSRFNAFQVDGPGVAALLVASTALVGVTAVGLAWLWWRAWRRPAGLTPDAVAWLCLAAVTAFVVTSRVLSPQYLLWLLPAAAAAVAVARTARGRTRLLRWAGLLLLATLATHLVFPMFYAGIVAHREWSVGVVLVLTARNALLVWLLVEAARESWWHLTEAGCWSASRPGSARGGSAAGGAGPTTATGEPPAPGSSNRPGHPGRPPVRRPPRGWRRP